MYFCFNHYKNNFLEYYKYWYGCVVQVQPSNHYVRRVPCYPVYPLTGGQTRHQGEVGPAQGHRDQDLRVHPRQGHRLRRRVRQPALRHLRR